jgi:predicted acetyltransferase
MAARSAPVHGALWRFLLDLDLSAEISAHARPLDEPLRWMLADPRRLRTTRVCDHLWVRVLDIPAALAARGYSSDDRLVLEVADPARNASSSFTVDTSAEAGACRRSRKGEEAELALSLADLGAIYLGGIAPSVLASAGRVRELRRGALARADRAFASPSAPFCSIDF